MREAQRPTGHLYACIRLLLLVLLSLFLPQVFLFLHTKRASKKNNDQLAHEALYFVDKDTIFQEGNIQAVCSCGRHIKQNKIDSLDV